MEQGRANGLTVTVADTQDVPSQAELDAAQERHDAALAEHVAMLQAHIEKTDVYLAASAELQRLQALATPLRDWLLREFDGRLIHTRPATPRQLAKRAHRDPAVIEAALVELVDEGFVCKVGNGYRSPTEAPWPPPGGGRRG